MDSTLRALADLRDRTLQKSRIAFGNRLSAIERGVDQPANGTAKLLTVWFERLQELEELADKDIQKVAAEEAIVEQMVKIKGIGLILAAKVVSMIDIERCNSVSALWRYAGYAVIDGEREKNVKGERSHYNKRLKTTLYLVASSFLKCNSPYRRLYDVAKEYYERERPDWTKLHRHYAAMRKMTKIFLQHLWLRWRELEGLPTSQPYVIEYLGHVDYMRPEEFGWEAIEQ